MALQVSFKSTRRVGKQKMVWVYNVLEWTGRSFHEFNSIAMNRSQWRQFANWNLRNQVCLGWVGAAPSRSKL